MRRHSLELDGTRTRLDEEDERAHGHHGDRTAYGIKPWLDGRVGRALRTNGRTPPDLEAQDRPSRLPHGRQAQLAVPLIAFRVLPVGDVAEQIVLVDAPTDRDRRLDLALHLVEALRLEEAAQRA